MIVIKRIYDAPDKGDGYRALVDRLWPRGLTREAAAIDAWLKDLAPSPDLRRQFNSEALGWEDFVERYRSELAESGAAAGLADLRNRARSGTVTLLYAKASRTENSASVLRDVLVGRE